MTAPDPEVTAELTDLARTLDLYKGDGTLDLDKAQKIHDYNRKVAEQVALSAAEKYAEDQLQLWIEENTK